MQAEQALSYSRDLLARFDVKPSLLTPVNFLEYASIVADVAKCGLTREMREDPVFRDWVETWARLVGEFDRLYAADPSMCYVPMNDTALAFHKSEAFIRYFRGGNRTSKTTTGYHEHWRIHTQCRRWRRYPGEQHTTFIVSGLPFTVYFEKVFERKFITGEQGNILSPMFPPGGKWLHRYDRQQKIIYLACPECAHKGQAEDCPHPKGSITLFSGENGPKVLEAFKGFYAHIDEHVDDGFLPAIQQRLADTPGSCIGVTGTPLDGPEAWEQTQLADVATGAPEDNRAVPDNPDSLPLVELFEISQWDAGVIPHDRIRTNMLQMDDFEIEARVYGKPAVLAKNPVFSRRALSAMKSVAKVPNFGSLVVLDDVPLDELHKASQVEWVPRGGVPLKSASWAGWRLWEHPLEGAVYVIGADIASGLTSGDHSAASVLKIERAGKDLTLSMVAQFYGQIDLFDYADELKKAAVYYNEALCAPEVTGLGRGTVLRLRKQLFYWNIYRGEAKPELTTAGVDPRLGVDTSMSTKPMMVGICVQAVKEGRIYIPCAATIWEMNGFEQERSDSGKSTNYRGADGARDDRTMSIIIAAFVGLTYAGLSYLTDTPKVCYNGDELSPDGLSPEEANIIAKIKEDQDAQPNPFQCY